MDLVRDFGVITLGDCLETLAVDIDDVVPD